MTNKDVAIPIVFPDYLIAVNTPAVTVKAPGFFPDWDILPKQFTVPATKQKLPYLGHAGILFFNGSTGVTKYYEYGRYDPAALGLVRKLSVPDVTMADDGRPTRKSLAGVLAAVSRKSGQNGKISGAYIELDAGAYVKMLGYAADRMKENGDADREPYALLSNSCLHFMRGTAVAGGARMPTVVAPQPAGYIVQVRLRHTDLDFELPDRLTVEDIELK